MRHVHLEGQVAVHVGVEVEESVFDEGHDGGARHVFGDRREHEHRVRRGSDPLLDVGPPGAAREHDLVPSHDGDGDARRDGPAHLLPHEPMRSVVAAPAARTRTARRRRRRTGRRRG
jgi:hypothetical protein